jgi:hypothetical protein
VFSDGSVLDSIENIAVECGQRDMTGTNTLTGDYFTTSSSLYTTGHWWSRGVGIAENLRVNGRAIFNDILAVYQVLFYKSNSFWEYHYFYSRLGRTFNEQTIRGRVNSSGGRGDCSILADDNVFTGLNSFTQDLGTTGITTREI